MSPTAGDEHAAGVPSSEALRVLSLALEQTPLAVVMTANDCSIHYANSRFCELTGHCADDLATLNMFDLSAHAAEELVMWAVISAGRTWRGELPGMRRDGGRFWASAFVAPVHDADGNPAYYLGIFDEIEEPHPQFPTDIAPDMLLLIDTSGKILYTNRTVPGLSREQATGDTVFSFVPPSYHERLRGHIDLAISAKRPVTYEIPSLGPHGTIGYYVSQLMPIERDGEVIALSIATIDLSRRAIRPRRRQVRRGTQRPPRDEPAPELSDRESQVLELLVQGLTNRQVAQRLRVSLRTIDHHVSHILKKLAVPNRTAAALVARRTGLLRPR